jgi:uncharacterized protein
MLQIILLAVIIYILYKWLRLGPPPARKARGSDRQPPSAGPQDAPVEEMAQDPVCGTWVPISQALPLAAGKESVYFCSAECREKYRQGQAKL